MSIPMPKLEVKASNSCNWRCCGGSGVKKSKIQHIAESTSDMELTVQKVYHRTHKTKTPPPESHTPTDLPRLSPRLSPRQVSPRLK